MVKLFFKVANDLRLIAIMYVGSLILGAYLFHVFEKHTFLEGLWWACVTALTIGYGDLSPATPAGQIMGVMFSHFWIFVVAPMIIGNIISNILQDKQKFTHAEQEWQEKALKAIAEKAGVMLEASPRDF